MQPGLGSIAPIIIDMSGGATMASVACPAMLRFTPLTAPALGVRGKDVMRQAVMRIPSVHIAHPHVESVVFGPGIFRCLARLSRTPPRLLDGRTALDRLVNPE